MLAPLSGPPRRRQTEAHPILRLVAVGHAEPRLLQFDSSVTVAVTGEVRSTSGGQAVRPEAGGYAHPHQTSAEPTSTGVWARPS